MWHDLTGQTFNNLYVVGRSNEKLPYASERCWDCKCMLCGKHIVLRTYDLLTKRNLTCGCLRQSHLEGEKFGKLTVLEEAPPEMQTGPPTLWKCLCVCGEIRYVDTHSLDSGKTTQCKTCASFARKTYHTPEEKNLSLRYRGMLNRCYNKNSLDYPNWGGRGITVCQEWRDDIWKFINWSLTHGYAPDLSIDRIDNNGPYSPENCRWVDMKIQSLNKRSNVYITVFGKTKTCVEWSRFLGLRDRQVSKWHCDYGIASTVKTIKKLILKKGLYGKL